MANTKVTGGVIADGAITAAKIASGALDGILNTYLTTNTYATQSYVTTAVNNLIDAAPASLDTLNELAAALNDDANFATTVTNSLATKLNLSGGTISGNLTVTGSLTSTLSTAAQPNITSIGTLSSLAVSGSGTFDGDVIVGNAGGTRTLTIGNEAVSTGAGFINIVTSSLFKNWQIAANQYIQGLSFVPSTTNGGTTFTTPVLDITSSGNVGIGTSSPQAPLQLIAGGFTDGSSIQRWSSTNDTDNQYSLILKQTVTTGVVRYNFSMINNNVAYNDVFVLDRGNVGIGTSSPTDTIGYGRALDIQSATGAAVYLRDSDNPTTQYGFLVYDGYDNGLKIHNSNTSGFLRFDTSATERMRIDSTGNVGIGTSSPGAALDVRGGNSANIRMGSISGSLGNLTDIGSLEFFNSDANQNAVAASIKGIRGASFGSGGYLTFFTSAAGNPAGALTQKMQIDTLGNIGAPSGSNIYNASDERLKQNIVSIENGLETICNLNPVKFNWIEGFSESEQGKDMLGFVAQEVQQVLPEAVEDFANNTLNIGDTTVENPLRVNDKFIIPVLVKAIQELKAEIETLKSQINA